MRCLFLYNPASGKGKLTKRLPYIRRRLEERFSFVECRETKSCEDLEEQVKRGAEEFDALVFSGGDGTFHHVLQGLGGRDVPLGYLPSGTVNDAARSLGIPKSLNGALNVILHGDAEYADCMRLNGAHYCVYIAAAGAFTSVTYETPQKEKRVLGKAAYAIEGLRRLNFEPFPVKIECDGEQIETRAALVFVMGGRFVAGFPVNKRSSICDGQIETVIVKQAERTDFKRKVKMLCTLAHLFAFGCKAKKKDVAVLRGKCVKVQTDADVLWDLDGERGIKGNVTVEVLHKGMRLFLPKRKGGKRAETRI